MKAYFSKKIFLALQQNRQFAPDLAPDFSAFFSQLG